MKIGFLRVNNIIAVLLLSQLAIAQSGGGTNWFLISVVGAGILFLLGAVLSLTDSLMQVEANKSGIDTRKQNFGLFPSLQELTGSRKPAFVEEGTFHGLKKGYDLKLVGKPTSEDIYPVSTTRYALKPKDFLGMSPIPKILVEEGASVKAGEPLFFDKKRPDIIYVAPVSGEVVEIKRGEKRSIDSIIILADKTQQYHSYQTPNLSTVTREDLVSFLATSGGWTLINKRPFDIVPELDDIPVNIFVSTFDTAPLAPDNNVVIQGQESAFQTGLDTLKLLTPGKVFLGLNGNQAPHTTFKNAVGVEKHYFKGQHPAGNVGVHIHHVAPINRGESVWTLGVQEVIALGNLMITGTFDNQRIVALTGAEFKKPKYVKTFMGAHLGELLKDELVSDHNRIILGDVLSGKQASHDDFLSYKTDQVTVIKEGDEYELFGWLLPLAPRPSVSNTFPAAIMPNFEYEANTNTHGERRALVVSGLYESVTPMDIYPQHLVKAILTNDFEQMEGLGLQELSEEDVALCEFVCASKTPVQKIIRDGLNILQEQS